MLFSNKIFPCKNEFLFMALFAIFKAVFSSRSTNLVETCAEIYSQSNFSGEKFQLLDGEQLLNISVGQASVGCLKTGSMKIAAGCRIKTCDATNLAGNCQILEQGAYTWSNLSFLSGSNIVSGSCTCGEECKCSDIFMKKSSCARAYLKGGCKTCNALYTELVGSESHFSDQFVGKVEALRLRQGCTLTLFPERDFEGDEQPISNEILEDYKDIFKSYECECEDDEYVSKNHPPRPASYPALINIPNNKDDIIKKLGNYSEHLGLLASLKSLRNRRSPNHAYILTVGIVGSEQQAAINVLFDNPNIFKNGESSTAPMRIQEVRIPVPVDELGIANSELRIIDTPELVFSTRSLARSEDARVLATLDSFLASHEELSNRLPNVVLIFHNFNDTNMNGESPFVKLLQGVHSFREKITDEFYSNIIFVLSNFCSETTEIQLNPSVQIAQFKQAIENNTLFPHPKIITVAENNGMAFNLPMVKGYFKLPNGEYYPKNLFDKMELVTVNKDDLIGQAVLRTAFRNPYDFNITSRKFKLVSRKSSKVEFYRSAFSSNDAPANFSAPSVSTFLFGENLVAGHGYNIFNDTRLPTSPFQLEELRLSDLRFMIPKALNLNIVQKTFSNFFMFGSHANYVEHRLHDLGIEGNITEEQVEWSVKSGYNIKTIYSKNDSCDLSATKEFRQFELVLNDNAHLTNEFVSRVKSLPIFIEENHDSVEYWRAFFNKYGTHIVQSIYGGGTIEVQLKSNFICHLNGVNAFFGGIKFMEKFEDENNDSNQSSLNYSFQKETGISLKLEGGNPQYHTTNFSNLDINEVVKLVKDWKTSLGFSPIILTTKMKLLPISEVIKKLGKSYVQQFEKAISFLYKFTPGHHRRTLRVISRQDIPFQPKLLVAPLNTHLFKVQNDLIHETRKQHQRWLEIFMKQAELEVSAFYAQRDIENVVSVWFEPLVRAENDPLFIQN